MRAQTATATDRQHELARLAGRPLSRRLPRLVAAATLRTWFAEDLALPSSTGIPDWLGEALQAIEEETGRKPNPPPKNRNEAEAWLQHLRLRERIERLVQMPLSSGDIAQRRNSEEDDGNLFIISSLTDDGAVWFRGGRGARAWPDQINIVVPTDELHERELRRQALARAAAGQPPSFSRAAARDLQEFRPERSARRDTIDELRSVIDGAKDESSIQKFLTQHSGLLALLLRGPDCYVRPQVRLGSQYVADFAICDIDSIGPRWVLIELETPISSVTLKTKDQFEQHAREGIAQIDQWRDWLRENLHYARKCRSDDGSGLPGIRPEADGIVIVGRRHLQHDNAAKLKARQQENHRVQVHTYDWLVEQIEGSLGSINSPMFNSHIFPRPQTPDDGMFV